MVGGTADALVECVPNVSEGVRPEVMDAIQAAVQEVPGAFVLDRHADAVHNRMVLTFAGGIGPVAEAAFRCARRAAELIDMAAHRGVHPRMGAIDVLPFVPLASTPMSLCVDLARRVGQRIAAELDLPVYLYGEAATRPERRRLADVRRGEYEGIRDAIEGNPALAPDFGPPRLGGAGAVAVGARTFLVAYNVTLRSGELRVAEGIARAVRESSGGLAAVQARGFPTADPGIVQVSMNLLDTRLTPLHAAFEAVCAEASKRGVEVLASELVGLTPTAVLAETTRHYLRLGKRDAASAIEVRLLDHALGRLATPEPPGAAS